MQSRPWARRGMLWRLVVPGQGGAADRIPRCPGWDKAGRGHQGSCCQDKHSKTQEALRMPNKSTVASVARCYQKGNKRDISTVSTARGKILWKKI